MQTLIRMQADDFLNAYYLLNKHNEDVAPSISVPAVVCLAFAVELYIKDISSALNLDKPKGKAGHNILTLFENLPEPIKKGIFNHNSIRQNSFNTRGNIFSPKRYTEGYSEYERFIDEIEAISESFVQWRYSFEQKRKSLSYNNSFALSFIDAIKSVSDNISKKSNKVSKGTYEQKK